MDTDNSVVKARGSGGEGGQRGENGGICNSVNSKKVNNNNNKTDMKNKAKNTKLFLCSFCAEGPTP